MTEAMVWSIYGLGVLVGGAIALACFAVWSHSQSRTEIAE